MNDMPVAIVSGASRGLGAAVARWLAKAGSAITLIARSTNAFKDVAKDVEHLGGASLVIQADVSDPDTCQQAALKTIDRYGRIDSLVNNAGIVQPIASITQAEAYSWRYNIEVNLLGPFYLARAVIPELRKQKGRIINVSSGAADIAIENVSAYCAAKAALNHFTRVLAAEETALTVLAVRPGVVDTHMQAIVRQDGVKAMSPEQAAYYQELKDRGTLEPPSVPARSIAWLARHAPHEFSGKILDYDDPRISKPALKVFGEKLE